MEKVIIVAIADNNAIGKDNALLWHISEDLKFFKRTTVGCPVIMGRKTFESIGRPLPKRLNVVVSRHGFDAPEGVVVADSLDSAFAFVEKNVYSVIPGTGSVIQGIGSVISSEQSESGNPCTFIIGGGQIYAQAMQAADRLIITHVHTVIEDADTFFPQIDPAVWKVSVRSDLMTDPETGCTFEFVEYIRK